MTSCTREREITALVRAGQWPNAADPGLRTHAASCSRCGELLLVTQAFLAARNQSISQAPLASPGLIWWRAQLRRRYEAVERISKPITRAHIFALAVYLGLATGMVVSQARHGLNWLGWFAESNWSELQQSLATRTSDFWSSAILNHAWNMTLVIPAIAALALFSGVAIYLALNSSFDRS